MRHTRFASTTASIAAAMVLLSACSGTSGTGAAPAESGGDGAADLNTAIAAVTAEQLDGTTIQLARMFGDCEETTAGVTDTSKAGTECEAIQILTNKFNAENDYGITVERLGGADWFSYYDAFNASLAGGDPADIANLHDYALVDYAKRGSLLGFDPQAHGIDMGDATEAAQASVQWQDASYAVPLDSHATLAHLNVDLFAEAGWVDADGAPTMPTSTDEFLQFAKDVKDKTGSYAISVAFSNDPMGWRLFDTLMEQQGTPVISEDGTVNLDTDEARTALTFINTLIDEGYANKNIDYAGSIDEWKKGDSAILMNGTWVVNEYAAQTPFEYQVTDFPTLAGDPATWASSHMWVIPRQSDDDPVKYRASLEFAKFIYENTDVWAIATGHIAPRVSVIESAEYLEAPQRDNYTETALNNIRFVPQMENWTAAQDQILEQISATWLNDKDVDAALSEAQVQVEQILN